MPKVFIIVLNWNGWQDTIECLGSLQKVYYPNFEVAVVDNGSTDESVQKIDEFLKSPQNKLQAASCELQANLGFSGGNNAGIRYALKHGTDYVLLLNNDTTVAPDFLSKLVEAGESDPLIGVAGPLIFFYHDPSRVWFAGGKINWLMNKGTHLHYQETDRGQLSHNFETDYITGCALLIKREAVERIGLMTEDYFLYYEDADWSIRAKKAGYKIVLVPEAKIWHKVSSSIKELSAPYVYYHVRNGLLLAKRHGNIFTRFIVHGLTIYTLAKQLIKLFMPSKRVWARATMKGIFDFYKGKTGPYSYIRKNSHFVKL